MKSEYTPWVKLDRFKLAVVNAPLLRESAMLELAEYVKNGGRLLLIGNAGEFCYEKPELRHELTRLLGRENPDVFRVEAKKNPLPAPGGTPFGDWFYDPETYETVLEAAGVKRRIRLEHPDGHAGPRLRDGAETEGRRDLRGGSAPFRRRLEGDP